MQPGLALDLPQGPRGVNDTWMAWESAGRGTAAPSATYIQLLHPQGRATHPSSPGRGEEEQRESGRRLWAGPVSGWVQCEVSA